MGGTVQMRSKGNPLLGDLSQGRQTEYLKAPAVSEDRAFPGHELMQPPQFVNKLMSRPQVQVVGITQKDLGSQFLQLLLGYGLDRSSSANGHEHGCPDFPVVCDDSSQASPGFDVLLNELEFQRILLLNGSRSYKQP